MDSYCKFFLEKLFSCELNVEIDEENKSTYLTREETISKFSKLNQKYDQVRSQVAENSMKIVKKAMIRKGLNLIFTFFKSLYSNEITFQDRITLKDFKKIICYLKISNLSDVDINNIFKNYQKNNYSEYMTISSFKKGFLKKFSQKRKYMVRDKFQQLDFNNDGKLYLKDMREWFRPKMGISVAQETINLYQPVYFISCLNSFNNFIKNSRVYLIEKQFVEFYHFVSIFFENDFDFEDYLNNSWKKIFETKQPKKNYVTERENRIFNSPYGTYDQDLGLAYIGSHLNKIKISQKLANNGMYAGKKSRSQNQNQNFNKKTIDYFDPVEENQKFTSHFLKNDFQLKPEEDSENNEVINMIRKEGSLKLLTLYSKILKTDYNNDSFISIRNFSFLLKKTYASFFYHKKLDEFVQNFKVVNSDKINYLDFFQRCKLTLNEFQNNNLTLLFKNLDIFKSGLVVHSVLKNSFKAHHHPLVSSKVGKRKPYYQIY